MIKARQAECNSATGVSVERGSPPGPFVGIDLKKYGSTPLNNSVSVAKTSLTSVQNKEVIYKDFEGATQPFIGLGGEYFRFN